MSASEGDAVDPASAALVVEGRIRDYRSRFADVELAGRLRATGAVLVEGPRGCGKTQTSLRAARSAVRLDRDRAARAIGDLDPALLLVGEHPRLIDEWQLVPDVWNEVRADVDDHPGEPGRYILAGSSMPADDATRHTGSLRFTRLRMRPMSLAESGHSSAAVSLGALFEGQAAHAPDPGYDLRDIVERITVGGWPAFVRRDPRDALTATQDDRPGPGGRLGRDRGCSRLRGMPRATATHPDHRHA